MNRLKSEASPYLQQHANNPVDWFPWGKEALEKARNENKLIFISIGYSACHWCHVMEKESFENKRISDVLNESFISIKVDREERPDIDKSYMSAVQLMGVSGGWPLSCFASPEGKPFYGGTYFPPEQFFDIISKLAGLWQTEPGKIIRHGEGLCEGVQNSELIQSMDEDAELSDLHQVFSRIQRDFDREDGGLSRIPKFLTPTLYDFLIRYSVYYNKQEGLNHSVFTTRKVIKSGMYDQLEGGIARYSTDKKWFVPHFEKMLYDNSQFISLLASLYQITKNSDFLEKLQETIKFTEKEFLDDKGGYFSSLDADSDGVEGEYYTWKFKEVKEIAGNFFPVVKSYYGLLPEGNWIDERNILSEKLELKEISEKYQIKIPELKNEIIRLKEKLVSQREERIKPGLDNKIIASWNAMQVIALCDSWHATGDDSFLDMARKTGYFILNNLVRSDGSVIRVFNSNIPGFLDDYAFTMKAFMKLYQIGFEEFWLEEAKKLLEYSLSNFFDRNTSMFFYASALEENPVARQTEITDSVIPSSNSVMAEVLLIASVLYDQMEYRQISLQMLKNVQAYLIKNSAFFSNWATVQLLHSESFSEIVISGEHLHELRKGFCGKFLPGIVFAGAVKNSKLNILKGRILKTESKIYVCENQTCKLPVDTVDQAMEQLKIKAGK